MTTRFLSNSNLLTLLLLGLTFYFASCHSETTDEPRVLYPDRMFKIGTVAAIIVQDSVLVSDSNGRQLEFILEYSTKLRKSWVAIWVDGVKLSKLEITGVGGSIDTLISASTNDVQCSRIMNVTKSIYLVSFESWNSQVTCGFDVGSDTVRRISFVSKTGKPDFSLTSNYNPLYDSQNRIFLSMNFRRNANSSNPIYVFKDSSFQFVNTLILNGHTLNDYEHALPCDTIMARKLLSMASNALFNGK